MKVIKTVLASILILFSLPVFMLADPLAGTEFRLSHSINVSEEYHFEFWKTGTQEAMTSASFNDSGLYNIATLGIIYNKDVSFTRLEIEVSELTQTVNGNPEYLDFTFYLYKPNTETEIPFSANLNGHGAGSSVLAENKTFSMYSLAVWNTDELADLRINIDDSSASPGAYTGTITFTFTT